jgi:hypothetical protein
VTPADIPPLQTMADETEGEEAVRALNNTVVAGTMLRVEAAKKNQPSGPRFPRGDRSPERGGAAAGGGGRRFDDRDRDRRSPERGGRYDDRDRGRYDDRDRGRYDDRDRGRYDDRDRGRFDDRDRRGGDREVDRGFGRRRSPR